MRLVALKQANEIAAVERSIQRALIKKLTAIKNLAIQHSGKYRLRAKDLKSLEDDFLTAQIVAHLKGKRRARAAIAKKAKKLSLQLDIVSDVLSFLRTADEDEIQQLVAQYSPATTRVLQNLTTRLTTDLRAALEEAILSNVTPRVAVTEFFSKEGLDQGKPYFVETLLRTQTQLAYQTATYEEYNSPEIQEILWGYEYNTVGDDRVRENHAAADGIRRAKDDPFWTYMWPPNGYNCRCQVLPVFIDEDLARETKVAPLAEPDTGFNFAPTLLVNI